MSCSMTVVHPSFRPSRITTTDSLFCTQGRGGSKWDDARDARAHPSRARPCARNSGTEPPVASATRIGGTSAVAYVPCELTSLFRTAESNRLLTRFRQLTSPLCYLNESRVHLASDVNYFAMWRDGRFIGSMMSLYFRFDSENSTDDEKETKFIFVVNCLEERFKGWYTLRASVWIQICASFLL